MLQVLVENRLGRIINVTACLGRMSGPGTNGGLAPYRISKAGVNALTKNFAAETGNGKRGVFVVFSLITPAELIKIVGVNLLSICEPI